MFAIIIGILSIGVVLSLFFGLGNLTIKDSKARRIRSNKLMQLRIILQIGAVISVLILIFFTN